MRLQPGMSVQSNDRGHFAYCVRCGWQSLYCGYSKAKIMATTPGVHRCPGPQR